MSCMLSFTPLTSVFQFCPLYTTCTPPTTIAGLTAITCGRLAISSASFCVNVCAVPAPCAPLLLVEEGKTITVLVPSCPIRLSIYALTPCVNVRAAITAATPIKIPSIVRNERVRLLQSASNALPKFAPTELNGFCLVTRSCPNMLSSAAFGGGAAGGVGAVATCSPRLPLTCVDRPG